MKRILSLAAAIIISAAAYAQSMIKTVGTGGDYPNLSMAVQAINTGSIYGHIELQLISDITEELTSDILLQKSGTGAAYYNSVHIYPALPDINLYYNCSTIGVTAFIFQGENIRLDGRLNKTGAPHQLTIHTTGAMNNVILLNNRARHNQVQYVNFNATTTFSTATVINIHNDSSGSYTVDSSYANSYNTIKYNHFTSPNATMAAMLNNYITIGEYNYADTILGNNFSNINFDKNNGASIKACIYIRPNNFGHLIKGNSFYDTNGITPLLASTNNYIIYTSNNSSTEAKYGFSLIHIDSNYIGGTAPMASGDPMEINANVNSLTFEMIRVNGFATVSNNVIKNIDMKNSNNNSVIACINVATSLYDTTKVINNQIGGPAATDRINMLMHTLNNDVRGIVSQHGNITITGNTIQNIHIENSMTNGATNFAAFYKAGSGSGSGTYHYFADNVVGSATPINSIFLNNGNITAPYSMIGFHILKGANATLKRNVIHGLIDSTVSTSMTNELNGLYGICATHEGNIAIDSNTIHDLNTYNSRSHTVIPTLSGIILTGTNAEKVLIRNNYITDLEATNTASTNTIVAGITSWQSTPLSANPDSNLVHGNFIHNIINNSSNNNSEIYGIYITSPSQNAIKRVYNNVIALNNVPAHVQVYGAAVITSASVTDYDLRHYLAFHNSIHIDAGINTTTTAAISNFVNVQNNVLSNVSSNSTSTVTNYAILYTHLPLGDVTVLNNQMYTPDASGAILKTSTTTYVNLAVFKADNYYDIFSTTSTPNFVNANGNQPQHFVAQNSTYTFLISGVNTEFYNNPRILYYMGAFDDIIPLAITGIQLDLYQRQDNTVTVSWSVNHEKTIQYYEIQAANDAMQWSTISEVQAQGKSVYQYEDHNLLSGKRYYRIAAVTHDGNYLYSPVKWVEHVQVAEGKYIAYPNPTSQYIQLKSTDATPVHVQIYNYVGALVKEVVNYQMDTPIDIHSLSQGNYWIIIKGNDTPQQIPFIKR